MKALLRRAALSCLLLLFVRPLVSQQLQQPVAPINLIIDSDMAISVDDVGDHALLWALVNRGEVNVLAEVCSSANDFSAPLMHAIATYYGHPNVLIGAHQGTTPNLENAATSNYTQQIVSRFGIPGDTRANYPDAVAVYRQALANAPDHSVYVVANGYFEALQGLLQSQPDSISSQNGVQLVAQKVVRLVPGAGFFPSGNEHNMRVDADAVSFVYANWPVEIVNVGVEVSQDVTTGPDFSSSTTTDPVKAAYIQFNGGNPVPGFGQLPLLFAVRGLSTNFAVAGLNGQTTVENFSQSIPGQDNWFQTPNIGHSYLAKQATAAQLEAILNPLLQSSSTMPILRSISPSSVQAGGSAQTVALNGTNFFSDSQVQFNGSNRPTTFISSTQISVQLSASDLGVAGQDAFTVVNTEGGGWTSNTLNFTITAVAPTLTGISPATAVAGSGGLTLTATGTNFASTSAIQVNGSNLSTTFVSSGQLTATLPANDLSTAGPMSITVFTPAGGTSTSLTFTVNNPAPSLASLSPATVVAGSGAFTLTVNGSNFVNGSVVQVNGASRTTTFVSGTQVTAAIAAADIASAGTLSISVANPAPGGGASATASLVVNNPAPSVSTISPSNVTAGSGAFTLTVNGSNFVNGSVVEVNGASRTTTFVSGIQVTAAIAAADVASAGTLSISVANPAPGGGASATASLVVGNPAPSLSTISPSNVTAGSGAFTLTVNGSNFVNGSVVEVNGASHTTTFVSGTQVTAAIAAADVASAGTLSISVANPAPGGGASAAVGLVVNNSLASLSTISPSNVRAGSGAFTLTVNGSNFVNGSVVEVNGASRTTTFVSGTQVTAAIAAADIASAGTLSISVANPAPGGGVSPTASLIVNNPVPSVSTVSPSNVTAGSGAFTLTVNGSNFVSGSVVQVNGSSRTTTFVNGTQITAAIAAADIASAGTLSISVANPTPGGGASATASLVVGNPVPSLSTVSPSNVTAGSGAFTLTVNGSNFVNGSVVQVNGSSRTTTFVSGTQITAAIAAADIASSGSLSISVANPAPGGGASATVTLAVSNAGPSPAPTLSSLSPDSVIAGSGAFTLTVIGTNFVTSSVVQVNGANRPTTFISSTKLTAAIPATDVATASFPSISVFNPAPGGGVWSQTFAVNNPLPTLSSLSPDSVIVGSGAFTLTVIGTNFIPSSVVQVNGSNRSTTFVSSTQLTAAIPAADVATASFPSISVSNPGPGGGVWSQTFAVNNPQPTLSNLSPDSVNAGGGAFTLTLTGTNFIPSSVVQVNGSNRSTTFVSSTQLTAAIPASDIASAADLSISVANPGPGGGVWSITLPVN